MRLPLDAITVGERLRPPSADAVAQLAGSLAELGLLHPITVTAEMRLVAGYHRLLAARRLGWTEIEAQVLNLGLDAARLAELDENLIRNELTALEKAEHLAERKRLYEAMHPETRRGVAGGKSRQGAATDNLSFAESTAAQLGESARNIRRAVALVAALDATVRDALRSLPIADNRTELGRLARLPEAERPDVVAGLVAGARSVKEAQRAVVVARIRAEAPPLPEGPYRVLVMDPPWSYGKRAADASHRAALDYPPMSLEEIAALPVGELACIDAVLWLWATNAYLAAAHELAAGWGFAVKTALTWGKNRPGLGDWLRGQTEHALLCVRGRPTVELSGQSTLLVAPRREHSRKPEEFYALVESLCPGSKIELFAREPRDGWASWGAELGKFGDAK